MDWYFPIRVLEYRRLHSLAQTSCSFKSIVCAVELFSSTPTCMHHHYQPQKHGAANVFSEDSGVNVLHVHT
jgi:hypothetical protein